MKILNKAEVEVLLASTIQDKWSLLGCNIFDLIGIDAAVAASEKTQTPVLIQCSYGSLSNIGNGNFEQGLKQVSSYLNVLSEHSKADAQVLLGVDHFSVQSFDEREDFWRTVDKILNTKHIVYLMVDASSLSLEENIKVSEEARKRAHAKGVLIETEINATPGKEDGESFEKGQSLKWEDLNRYIEIVQPDLIGFDVGLKHGSYGRGKCDIQWEILEKFKNPPYYVLHGGSSAKEEDLKKGKGLISKVNISSDFKQVVFDKLKINVEAGKSSPAGTRFAARDALTQRTEHYLNLLGK